MAHYEYYPDTKYGKHAKSIQYIFTLDSNSYIKNAVKKEKNTGKKLVDYKYKSKTKYGTHGSKITSVILNAPIIPQLPELPTGCEITAVTMMLSYKGANVNKIKLANEMPRHGWNPNLGYVGNPLLKTGWTIYPPALMNLVKKYAGSAQNLTGVSNKRLEQQIRNNKPVVVWASVMHGFTVHAITLTGFDGSNYYYNDPWTGKKDVKISKSEFNRLWANQEKRAISY